MSTDVTTSSTRLEQYFAPFRAEIIGVDSFISVPGGEQKKLIYADWTASGRMFAPIEKKLYHSLYPLIANTHTDTNATGEYTTEAYHKAQQIIKKHVNAQATDVLITCGSGMTGVINKLQRILGLKIHERFSDQVAITENERPIVFVTHMEHHSNQTSWLETIAEVEIIAPNAQGLPDLNHFETLLEKYADRKLKIASVSAASNVTGIQVNYHKIAQIIHREGGYCFVDFACAAPYVTIDMHPETHDAHLDAIFFSPHKFLGGPGTSGVLVFNQALYTNKIPDHPGGGTVQWTNPWGEHAYFDSIEAREDGGTPGFLQTIRTAMCIRLKERMSVKNIQEREHEMNAIVWSELEGIENLHILAEEHRDRLSIFSFYIDGLQFNLAVRMLNDFFGIQTRGGCSCAGTYGHYLLRVDKEQSDAIVQQITAGNCSNKPGWVRMSLHPTMTNEEVFYICDAIKEIATNSAAYLKFYNYDPVSGSIRHIQKEKDALASIEKLFDTV